MYNVYDVQCIVVSSTWNTRLSKTCVMESKVCEVPSDFILPPARQEFHTCCAGCRALAVSKLDKHCVISRLVLQTVGVYLICFVAKHYPSGNPRPPVAI